MADVIILSSDDSDVEVLGSHCEFTKFDPLPLSEVRIDVEAVNRNIPPCVIDLTDSTEQKWSFPECEILRRLNCNALSVIDLTEIEPDAVISLQQTDGLIINEAATQSSIVTNDCTPQPDLDADMPKQKSSNLISQKPSKPPRCTPVVELTRLSFLETNIKEHKKPGTLPLHLRFKRQNYDFEANRCKCNPRTTAGSNAAREEPSTEEEPPRAAGQGNPEELTNTELRDKECQHGPNPIESPVYVGQGLTVTWKDYTAKIQQNGFHSPNRNYSPPVASPFEQNTQTELLPSGVKPLESDTPSTESCTSDQPLTLFCPAVPNSGQAFEHSKSFQSKREPLLSSEHEEKEKTPDWQVEIDNDLAPDSPVFLPWQGESDGEDMNDETRHDVKFREVSREERQTVCLKTLSRAMAGPFHKAVNDDHENHSSEVLSRQTLSLVYSTIEENFPEATLQFLSDLLRPGYHPPKDITNHLLRGILLDPVCPYTLSVQAFNLLRRTQKHHRASRNMIPWDWDLLTSVLSNQDSTKKHRCEVVRMFLEYIALTLEDDFQARCSSSSLNHSIAKTVLSCDRHFPRVRDVIQWLFSAIVKSTEQAQSPESIRERDEQRRIVFVLQRMLSLSLEVDRSPALNSAKLSQELFHMLLSHVPSPSRAHRMFLLESLQNQLLRCKLLEHLLDYACPQKTRLPMSLSLLLHFLKNCTPAPDPTDGCEKWLKWEELIHLLWMLLLSYTGAMKGCLGSGTTKQKGTTVASVFKQEDYLSKRVVREAVEAFLSRSREDLGESLPLHVEESLTYIQDHLLDVCRC